MIHIASIQHTGTWFIIDFLRQHSQINKFIEFKDIVLLNGSVSENKNTLLHSHIAVSNAGIHRNDRCKHIPPIILNVFMNTFKTIISLRDPMLSLITRLNRHPELNHEYIINAFNYVATLKNVFFIPIDTGVETRYTSLKQLLSYLGLPEENYVKEYAEKWEAVNSTIDIYNLKEYYADGDFYNIFKKLPMECKLLIKSKNILKPFFKSWGYKNLLWFDKEL